MAISGEEMRDGLLQELRRLDDEVERFEGEIERLERYQRGYYAQAATAIGTRTSRNVTAQLDRLYHVLAVAEQEIEVIEDELALFREVGVEDNDTESVEVPSRRE